MAVALGATYCCFTSALLLREVAADVAVALGATYFCFTSALLLREDAAWQWH